MSSFECQRCGRCCKQIGIPWSELDPRLAAAHLQVELAEFVRLHGFSVNAYTGAIEHPEAAVTPCPFLSYDATHAVCTIYPVRPWICKGYPGPGMVCANGLKRPQ